MVFENPVEQNTIPMGIIVPTPTIKAPQPITRDPIATICSITFGSGKKRQN